MNTFQVLNLIINGLPSIPNKAGEKPLSFLSFKPYYKWITFNTAQKFEESLNNIMSFKPYYKWITFNTISHSDLDGVTSALF